MNSQLRKVKSLKTHPIASKTTPTILGTQTKHEIAKEKGKMVNSQLIANSQEKEHYKKHGGNITFTDMVRQIEDMVNNLTKFLYPWIKLATCSWKEIIGTISLSYITAVGNQGLSSYVFCIGDDERHLIYAKAKGRSMTTNTKVESMKLYYITRKRMGCDYY
ncbi:hypothetical protein H5410_060285 [Solanum commersonii]|uniref:Uncharacterized protein n=1 Tax=Solanum commersonii TaxID=4109 RepID=A0A9J5W567_SOLCO|nr:hypothetical protein H5410_060285 [Solanum commersonii]